MWVCFSVLESLSLRCLIVRSFSMTYIYRERKKERNEQTEIDR